MDTKPNTFTVPTTASDASSALAGPSALAGAAPADRAALREAMRPVRRLLAGYLGLSVLTLAVAALLRHHPGLVDDAVWVRGTIVVLSAALTCAFAASAARGSYGAFRRLRIVTSVMAVAIVVIVSLPGLFPAWVRVEQGVCGLLLVGVSVLLGRPGLRRLLRAR